MNTDSMSVAAPSPAERSARQAEVVQALTRVVPQHSLLWHSEDTTPYECDGLTAYRQRPLVVCLPETETQVQACLLYTSPSPRDKRQSRMPSSA